MIIQWGKSTSNKTKLPLSYTSKDSYKLAVTMDYNDDSGHLCYAEFFHRIDGDYIGSYDGSDYHIDFITIGY